MSKLISILGSTGSVGVQTLDVIRNLGYKVIGLTANSNVELLEKQVREFKPRIVAVGEEVFTRDVKNRFESLGVEIYSGEEGLIKVATADEAEMVVASIVGIAGLVPVFEAIKKGKDIALANKEVLVAAGEIVMAEVRKRQVKILPVDSEHSAVFQCLHGNKNKEVNRIILTASGGPFRGKKASELENVSVEDALAHPNWKMGSKITIDSATLMNKGLEVIEARWLFDIQPEKIDILIHPQSIIHSMVEYIDGSVIAQLGIPDMRVPIQYALSYPSRRYNNYEKLDLLKYGKLTFEEPDYSTFSCLRLAYEALAIGGTMPAAMNGANEEAVNLFLNKKIRFGDIPRIIKKVMDSHTVNIMPDLNDIIKVDCWARNAARNACTCA
ncbi:MAG TPA: 1-deoxy-D-xylulose-5-phosphate reductoisomerase [Clostridiaceae bacterium]|nr:1-deoxy-D-xylulose-5-phosphate reductoisomerase [Clostridiaceae bacterium]